MPDNAYRQKIDLSGVWNYSIDGGPSGNVKVPSAYDFTGKVTFERNIGITAEQLDQFQFLLVMYGVNHSCEVTLNGDFVTTHAGGYTSFVQPIPRNTLQVGSENRIRVTVSNELDPRRTLPLRPGVWAWRNYGGILRDVFILAIPKLAISDAIVTSRLTTGDEATISVDAGFEGSLDQDIQSEGNSKRGASVGMYVEVLDKISGFPVAKSGFVPVVRQGNEWERSRVEVRVTAPKLWSPDSPELYLVKVMLAQGNAKEYTVFDEFDVDHGIRSLKISDGHFILNGKRLLLKGVVWQEDHPNFGSAMSTEEIEKDVVLIKGLGANCIRFGNHPPHPYMLNLCDRYGLLALEELPILAAPSAVLEDDYFAELASTMMREMVVRDRNHVSVLAWGIGDEIESSTRGARNFVENMVRLAKSMDDRPTYYGSRIVETDICSDLVDIAALNTHTQDPKVFKKELEEWKQRNGGRPVIVSKFGTEVKQGNRNGYSDPLSYEAQAKFYIQRFDIVKGVDYDGACVWSFNDWKGDHPALTVSTGDPWMHTLGLVSYEREKRLAYDAVRAVFRGEKFVALPVGSYSASAPIIFVISGLVVLIGTAYFYNANRRFRDNLNRSLMNLYNFFADVRDQRIVSLVHTAILGVIISVAGAIVVSSILYHFRDSWVLDNLLSYVLASDALKESFVRLVWNPLKCIGYLSAAFFLKFLLLYVILMFLSMISKAKIFSYHAFVITVWSSTPLLILVPIGMILYRIMESPVYVLPSFIIFGILLLWVFMRMLKGISIIFDASLLKVNVLGFLSVFLIAFVGYAYLDHTQSASIYIGYMYHTMINAR